MQWCLSFPLDVRFRDMEPSPALEAFAHRWAAKLANVYDRIERCEVVIERPHQHQRRRQPVHVRVTVSVPGTDIVVTDDHAPDGVADDAFIAVRDAFRAARRRLVMQARRDYHGDVAVARA
ncbi:MAG TPA: HPF/RaiA family ribosome-associated protein [Kofleriaceae bacterium]|nr:HPF/RaiA family ribosome-associated protein [Kofleriaceae bacterium]